MSLHGHSKDVDELLRIDPLFMVDGNSVVPPALHMPANPLPAETAYRIVSDELLLDGNAHLNLATFVTTWMEPEGARLMADCAEKNMIDRDEYPQTAELERRCVNILADLWHAPSGAAGVGCSTTGSSEACMLGGLALKRRWRRSREAGGETSGSPNLVMGANVQVCWEKFCNYFEVEPRLISLAPGRYHLDPELVAARCDENTIGVVAIMGSTFDGSYEPVRHLAAALDDLEERSGLDVAIHVDGASGAMIAPFLDVGLEWDFRLPRVASINTSGHKYGRVYPGVGWIVWRDQEALPDELVFRVNYLGGEMPTFALNFSRPGAQVVAQYYNFIRLGHEGYRLVHQACRDVAMYEASTIAEMGPFRLISDGSELPVFAFTTTDDAGFDCYALSERLRQRGWQVPAYTFPPDCEDLLVCRIVVRHGKRDLADLLLHDIRSATSELIHHGETARPKTAFHH
jgi:glutamate decarboxylase